MNNTGIRNNHLHENLRLRNIQLPAFMDCEAM